MRQIQRAAIVVIGFFVVCLGAFAQQIDESVVREYRIGPKDVLEITVFERPALNQTVRVSEDGSITLSLLGRVVINGLTKDDAEKRIAALLEEKYLQKASVTIFIKEYQSSIVSVVGAVVNTGIYQLIGRTTLLQIISKAGGLTDRAGTELFILRESQNGAEARIAVDLEDLVLNGNQKLNIPLRAGDIVNIPVDQIINVFVFGEVRNPGVLQARISKKINILQAIAQAGGLTDGAARSRITITRKDRKTGRETKIKVNLNDVIKGKKPAFELQEGDVVYVPESIF